MRRRIRHLIQYLFYDAQEYTLTHFIFRSIILTGLIIWSWEMISYSIASGEIWDSFLHLPNLIFHEAGHVIFTLIGFGHQFLSTLGGTLGQLLIPLICTGVLLVQTRDPFGASVGLWWFGQNFLDIAPYISDARAGVLPLLGGGTGNQKPYGSHDWNYLLSESNLLPYDQILAEVVFATGSAIMLLSLLWGGLLIITHIKNMNL